MPEPGMLPSEGSPSFAVEGPVGLSVDLDGSFPPPLEGGDRTYEMDTFCSAQIGLGGDQKLTPLKTCATPLVMITFARSTGTSLIYMTPPLFVTVTLTPKRVS